MSKYEPLWSYIGSCGDEKITLSFDKIEQIAGVPIDHSFLRYKNELTQFGYKVCKTSIKEQNVTFVRLPENKTMVLYIHGKHGTAEEVEHFRVLFPTCDMTGLIYQSETPWDAKAEFSPVFKELSAKYDHIILIANSIGAYFSMCSLPQEQIEQAYFISPILDMERLICDMMCRANVSEYDLREKRAIKTAFGEDLSWDYLCYARKYPMHWCVPTQILYGEQDNLVPFETVTSFANTNHAGLTVMKDGDHWFHTPEQIEFMVNWVNQCETDRRCEVLI